MQAHSKHTFLYFIPGFPTDIFPTHLFKKFKPVIKIMRYKNVLGIKEKSHRTLLRAQRKKKDIVWLLRSWQASGQETSKHTIVSKCESALLEKKAPWTQTGRASHSDEGLFGMTSGGKDAASRGKSSLTEKEAKAVQVMEKTLHILS